MQKISSSIHFNQFVNNLAISYSSFRMSVLFAGLWPENNITVFRLE